MRWVIFLLGIASALFAGMENHYIPGTNGLYSAMKPEKGFVYTGVYTHYHAEKIMNQEGKSVPVLGKDDHLNVQIIQNFFSYYTPLCFLGGKYGFQVNVPFMSTALDVIPFHQSFDVNNHLRLADVYLEPINLRYSWERFDLFTAYGFYIPTGRVDRYNLNNAGYGNWGNMLTLAGTWYIDCAQTWTLSAYATYEFHSKKRHLDFTSGFTPGQNLCLDWGLGKNFGKYFSLGLVGYYEQQTTLNRGRDIPGRLQRARDQVFAVGGEFDVVVPQINFGLTLRYEREFCAKSRTQGKSFILAASLAY